MPTIFSFPRNSRFHGCSKHWRFRPPFSFCFKRSWDRWSSSAYHCNTAEVVNLSCCYLYVYFSPVSCTSVLLLSDLYTELFSRQQQNVRQFLDHNFRPKLRCELISVYLETMIQSHPSYTH